MGSPGNGHISHNGAEFECKKAGIHYTHLPNLFQDIVAIARALEIEYIWVDRLCILQEHDEDFKTQSVKMGEIYGSATLTIAAASARTENDHILVPRERKWSPFQVEMDLEGAGQAKLQARRLPHTMFTEMDGGDYGKISTRAWAWQERLLAARTVTFTPAALKFECRCHSVWEGSGGNRIGHSWSAKLDSVTFSDWARLVEKYTKRDISRTSDRLPAVEGVMKRIAKNKGWSYAYGSGRNISSRVWLGAFNKDTTPRM